MLTGNAALSEENDHWGILTGLLSGSLKCPNIQSRVRDLVLDESAPKCVRLAALNLLPPEAAESVGNEIDLTVLSLEGET